MVIIFQKFQQYSPYIIGVGLGLIFLANSYTAFFSPEEFIKLVGDSFLKMLPLSADTIVKLIGVSDGLVGILLVLGLLRKYVAIYSVLWILGVIMVTGFAEVGGVLEHLGILSMPIYLFLNNKRQDLPRS